MKKKASCALGNVYQIANGYMGYRGTLDEFGPEQLVGITLAGIFDRVGDAWREPVNAPNGGFTKSRWTAAKFPPFPPKSRSHRQSLNLENAVFERETVFASHGKTLKIQFDKVFKRRQAQSGRDQIQSHMRQSCQGQNPHRH